MVIICLGDIVGETGMRAVERLLPELRRGADFVIANGENTRGAGISRKDAERLYAAGVDVITLGNHAFACRDILTVLDEDAYILRPANISGRSPGKGVGVYDAPKGQRVAVINLSGRLYMDANMDNPFFLADKLIEKVAKEVDAVIVDFHGEATSEKAAFARYVDGRVSAVFGTHTHVPTADARILPGGTGFITDAGMCGAWESVLGLKPEASIAKFVGELWSGDRQATAMPVVQGVRFEIENFRCVKIERFEEKA